MRCIVLESITIAWDGGRLGGVERCAYAVNTERVAVIGARLTECQLPGAADIRT